MATQTIDSFPLPYTSADDFAHALEKRGSQAFSEVFGAVAAAAVSARYPGNPWAGFAVALRRHKRFDVDLA